jgi:hypothetical protein
LGHQVSREISSSARNIRDAAAAAAAASGQRARTRVTDIQASRILPFWQLLWRQCEIKSNTWCVTSFFFCIILRKNKKVKTRQNVQPMLTGFEPGPLAPKASTLPVW